MIFSCYLCCSELEAMLCSPVAGGKGGALFANVLMWAWGPRVTVGLCAGACIEHMLACLGLKESKACETRGKCKRWQKGNLCIFSLSIYKEWRWLFFCFLFCHLPWFSLWALSLVACKKRAWLAGVVTVVLLLLTLPGERLQLVHSASIWNISRQKVSKGEVWTEPFKAENVE